MNVSSKNLTKTKEVIDCAITLYDRNIGLRIKGNAVFCKLSLTTPHASGMLQGENQLMNFLLIVVVWATAKRLSQK